METAKQKTESRTKENWMQARRQAKQMGIVLTRRRNSKGEYVCYLSKKATNGWLALLWKRDKKVKEELWNQKRKSNWKYWGRSCKDGNTTSIRILRWRCCSMGGARKRNTTWTGSATWNGEGGWVWSWHGILRSIAAAWWCKTRSKVICERENLVVSKKSSNFALAFGKIG